MALHLLDVNALIALGWDHHQHHDTMVGWFKRNAAGGWATSAISQAGFVRVLSQPTVSKSTFSILEWSDSLARVLSHPAHRLVPLDFAFSDVLASCTGGVVGHRQITDAYLLTTAARHGARLLTFDSGIRQLLATDTERERLLAVLN